MLPKNKQQQIAERNGFFTVLSVYCINQRPVAVKKMTKITHLGRIDGENRAKTGFFKLRHIVDQYRFFTVLSVYFLNPLLFCLFNMLRLLTILMAFIRLFPPASNASTRSAMIAALDRIGQATGVGIMRLLVNAPFKIITVAKLTQDWYNFKRKFTTG